MAIDWSQYEVKRDESGNIISSPLMQSRAQAPDGDDFWSQFETGNMQPGYEQSGTPQYSLSDAPQAGDNIDDIMNRAQAFRSRGMGAVADDAIDLVKNAPGDLINMLVGGITSAPGGLMQLTTREGMGRAGVNLLGGLMGILDDVQTSPQKILKYFSERGVLPENVAKEMERQQAYAQKRGWTIREDIPNVKESIIGEPQPGDEFWAGIGEFLPAILSGNLGVAAANAAFIGENPAAIALGGAAGKGASKVTDKAKAVKERSSSLKSSQEFLEAAKEAQSATQESMKKAEGRVLDLEKEFGAEEYSYRSSILEEGGVTPEKMQEQINKTNNQLVKLNEDAKKLPGPQALEANQRAVTLAQESIPRLEANTPILERNIRALESNSGNLSTKAQEIMGQGADHKLQAGRRIYEAQKAVENDIKAEYENINKSLKGQTFEVIDNYLDSPQLQNVVNQIKEAIPNISNEALSKNLDSIAKQLGLDTQSTQMPVKSLIDLWRETRDTGVQVLGEYTKNPTTKRHLYDQAQSLFNLADGLKEKMREVMPGDSYQRLIANNERFKKEVVPVKSLPEWYQLVDNKRFKSSNIADVLAGDNPGKTLLRNHAIGDPKTAAHVVGANLSRKSSEWGQPNELLKPYLDVIPELADIFDRYNATNRDLAHATESLRANQDALKEAQRTIKNLSPDLQKHAQVQKEANRLMNELDRKHASLIKLKKARAKMVASKNKLLREKMGLEELTKENKRLEADIKAEDKKIEKLKKDMEADRSKLMKIALGATGMYLGKGFFNRLFNKGQK